MKYTNTLPIPTRTLQRSISELRNTYRNIALDNLGRYEEDRIL